MRTLRFLLPLALALCLGMAWGQPTVRKPSIGYVYPAGARQGTAAEVIVGGQFLRGVTGAHVTGEGVCATVLRHYEPFRLDGEQAQELRKRVDRLWNMSRAELAGEDYVSEPAYEVGSDSKEAALDPVTLPDHPLIANLEARSLRELAYIKSELQHFRKRQPNMQIAENVVIAIEVDAGAKLGYREIRLQTNAGLTNPLRFEVGALPEIRETELNNPDMSFKVPDLEPVDVPVLINGQILRGDIDRFRIRAREGQHLVFDVHARRLMPYLADAVPGWFQATLALYDALGNEIAFADDYRFVPDPVLVFVIPESGEYEMEIRDAIYRGREDFVYRVSVGELPFVTEVFPLGVRAGEETLASIGGWNLPRRRMKLHTSQGATPIRRSVLGKDGIRSNDVVYAVDTLPECEDKEPNNTADLAQAVALPTIVNGRIEIPGDVDVYCFAGRAGDELVAAVDARRLNSPLDALLRLLGPSGETLAWNDDYADKDGHLHRGMGTTTHHADSYLRATLPEDGRYAVQISDAQRQGGMPYGYRLRLSPPRPGFSLLVSPSSVNISRGRATPINVHVLREDGFDGAIDLKLKGAAQGLVLDGAHIPAGKKHIRMTLSAFCEPTEEPLSVRIQGRAEINGEDRRSTALPADNLMQAFLYRHLTPSEVLAVSVLGARGGGGGVKLAHRGPVKIPAGGSVEIRVSTPRYVRLREVQLALPDPPEGLKLGEVSVWRDGLAFLVEANEAAAQLGLADNLIVEAFHEREANSDNARAPRIRRIPLGHLPAIPFEIVARQPM